MQQQTTPEGVKLIVHKAHLDDEATSLVELAYLANGDDERGGLSVVQALDRGELNILGYAQQERNLVYVKDVDA
jgi:hypothetical protein